MNYIEPTFFEQVDLSWKCVICKNILKDPIQLSHCKHKTCSSCLSTNLKFELKCPIDDKDFDRDLCYVDKETERQINEINIQCSQIRKSPFTQCSWTGKYKEWQSHLMICQYKWIFCDNNCGVKIQPIDLADHLEKQCIERLIQCKFCNIKIKLKYQESHINDCNEVLILCVNNCSQKLMARKNLSKHLSKECTKQISQCQFGCDGVVGKLSMMRQHNGDSFVEHIDRLLESMLEYQDIVQEHLNKLNELRNENKILSSKLEYLENLRPTSFTWIIDNYSNNMMLAKDNPKYSITSPIFSLKRYSYCFNLILYPFGEGPYFSQYVSIFVKICMGNYDNLLAWPFRYKLTFMLVDQAQLPSSGHHLSKSFRPSYDSANNSFSSKPQANSYNKPFGIPNWVKLDDLTRFDYIRDDRLCIKLVIDDFN